METVDKSAPVIEDGIRITQTDPADTRPAHLKAIQAAAEKRSYRLLTKLKSELSTLFSASGLSLERAFRAFDENRDGVIDPGEFSRGLKNLGAELSEVQQADLVALLDKDGDGSIDYVEFARWFGSGPPPPPALPEVTARSEARAAALDCMPQGQRDAHLSEIRATAAKHCADSGAGTNSKGAQSDFVESASEIVAPVQVASPIVLNLTLIF